MSYRILSATEIEGSLTLQREFLPWKSDSADAPAAGIGSIRANPTTGAPQYWNGTLWQNVAPSNYIINNGPTNTPFQTNAAFWIEQGRANTFISGNGYYSTSLVFGQVYQGSVASANARWRMINNEPWFQLEALDNSGFILGSTWAANRLTRVVRFDVTPEVGETTTVPIWHQTNHPTGIGATVNTPTATVLANMVFNSSGHYQSHTTRTLTAANIGAIPLTQRGAANGVATLDGNGFIPASQIPALAITETFVVGSEAAMLLLDAQIGDVAVRTDTNTSYILQADPASELTNWIALHTPSAETDPVFTASPAFGITAGMITNWNTAFGWGNHASAGYLTATTGDARYPQLAVSYADPAWITQLAWTKITGAPSSFPTNSNLQTVVTNGNTTTLNLAFPNAATGIEWRNGSSIRWLMRQDTFPTSDFSLYKYDDAGVAFTVLRGARATGVVDFAVPPTRAGNIIWDAANHVAGSAFTPTLTGANVLATLTVNSVGHVTALTTRALTVADIGAIQNNTSVQTNSNFWISGQGITDGNFQIRGAGSNSILGKLTFYNAGATRGANFQLNADTDPGLALWLNSGGTWNKRAEFFSNGLVQFYSNVTMSNAAATLDVAGQAKVGTIPALGTAATVFLTSNAGVISSRTAAQVLSDIGAGTSTKIQNGSNIFEALSPNGFRIDHQVGFPSGTGNMNVLMHDPFAAAGAPNVKALVANLNFVLAGTTAANAQNVRFTISQEASLLGGVGLGQKSVSANTTMGAADCVVYANSSGGTVTVTLQGTSVALSTGKIFIVKRTGSNTVTVQAANSGTINGTNTYTLGTDKQTIIIQYVGSDTYHVLSDSTPA